MAINTSAPAEPVAGPRLSVFIGSSDEAARRGIVSAVIMGMRDRFDVRPWDGEFGDDSKTTIQSLLDVGEQVDAAIMVCARDDTTSKRGVLSPAARDNVHMEYGLVLGALGLKRVSVLWEEGVDVPSDVRGLNLRFFQSDGKGSRIEQDPVLRHSLGRQIEEIADRWKELGPRPRPRSGEFKDGGIALTRTLAHADHRIVEIAAELDNFANKRQPSSERPIRFDSRRLCLDAYEEGLRAVQRRFWTTSFLDSDFWNNRGMKVLEANEEMLRRIMPRSGSARRLFLLDDSCARDRPPQKPDGAFAAGRCRLGDRENVQHPGDRRRALPEAHQCRVRGDGCA